MNIIEWIEEIFDSIFGRAKPVVQPPAVYTPVIVSPPIPPTPVIVKPDYDVLITRGIADSKQTLGRLAIPTKNPNEIGNIFSCETLELPWLNNQRNKSCVPAGLYRCVYSYQADLKEWHYLLQAVPNRDGCFIHEGDFFFNTLGCILLGVKPSDINGDGEIDITSSKPTTLAFENIMQKKDFWLRIQ